MAGQDPLDGGGGEVLAVDPQPLEVAPGEVEVARVVAVAEVAGPVQPFAYPGRVGLVVLVVALEAGRALLVDDLADGLVRIDQPALVVEAGPGALLARLGFEDDS